MFSWLIGILKVISLSRDTGHKSNGNYKCSLYYEQQIDCFSILGGYGGAPAVDNTPGPESDTIFVQGLGQDITKEKIAEYFGQIGVIKVSDYLVLF